MKEYKYYAFISYARKDGTKYAKYIQKELEHYRYPMAGIEESKKPNDKLFLRKVFLDLNELENSEKTFHEDLLKKIENSKYLIVLCTEESAKSKWVDSEIKHFLKTHFNDKNLIIPVLCNGKIPKNLPETLKENIFTERNLPSFVEFEGDEKNEAQERGLSQIIAYMLGLQRDKVFNRFQTEKRAAQKRIINLCLIILIMFGILTSWALYERKLAYTNEQKAIMHKNEAVSNEILAKKNEILAKENEKIAKENELKAVQKQEEQEYILDFYTLLFTGEFESSGNISVRDFIKSHIYDSEMLNYEPKINARLKIEMMKILSALRLEEENKILQKETVEIIKKLPESEKRYLLADYYYTLGLGEYMTSKNLDKALNYIEKSINLGFDTDRKLYDAYNIQSEIYIKLKKYNEAENTIKKAYNLSDKIKILQADNDRHIIFNKQLRDIAYLKDEIKKSILYNNENIRILTSELEKNKDINDINIVLMKQFLSEAYEFNAKNYFYLKEYENSLKSAKSALQYEQDQVQTSYMYFYIFSSELKINPAKFSKHKENYDNLNKNTDEMFQNIINSKKDADFKMLDFVELDELQNLMIDFLEDNQMKENSLKNIKAIRDDILLLLAKNEQDEENNIEKYIITFTNEINKYTEILSTKSTIPDTNKYFLILTAKKINEYLKNILY